MRALLRDVIRQLRRQPAAEGAYHAPLLGWTCFHCGETFHREKTAREHFGEYTGFDPACIERLKFSDAELMRRVRVAESLAERDRAAMSHAVEERDAEYARIPAFLRRFEGTQTLNDVFHLYDSMQGRAIAAEAILAKLSEMSPYLVERARELVCGSLAMDPQIQALEQKIAEALYSLGATSNAAQAFRKLGIEVDRQTFPPDDTQ
jgi:hypothetical protein